jgi:predicted permease
METFWQDVRFGLRSIAKNPGFALVVVLTLGLGLGANTTIFTLVNRMILRPLPVKDPGQLVVPAIEHAAHPFLHGISYLDYKDYRDQSADVFSDMAAYNLDFVGLSADNRPERLTVSFVTGNYFPMLGIQPALGRLILPSEGSVAGADPVVVLGYGYWKRRFNGDPGVVGKSVLVNSTTCTIVGVAPEKFTGTYALVEMEAYLPMGMHGVVDQEARGMLERRGSHGLHALGRLKPGVSIRQAEAGLQVIAKRLDDKYPDTNSKTTMHLFPELVARPDESGASDLPVTAAVFLALVGLVLLLACVNVANILLVRATTRQRELAIRAALGAGKRRLLRQFLTETLLLAALGGVVGVGLGAGAARMLSRIPLGLDIPLRFEFTLDWRVLLYAAATTLLAALIAGVLPALRAARADVNTTLREGGRGSSGGRHHHRTRNLLVGLQVALSVMLLVAAGLFTVSFQKSHAMDLGFDPHGVLNAVMDVQLRGYDEAKGRAFYRELERRLRALPGVDAVTMAFSIPMGYYSRGASIDLPGQSAGPEQPKLSTYFNVVDPNYFDVMRVPLVKGRALTEFDTEKSAPVAVVNETMAAKLWPNQDPIGKQFSIKGPNGPFLEVVGVMKDGKYRGPTEDPLAAFYAPIEQNYMATRALHVRSRLAPEVLGPMIQKELHDLDANLPIYDVRSMDQMLEGVNGFLLFKLGAWMVGAMGFLGLALAVVGVYGVVSYAANQRTHEIGVRMALGAGRSNILSMILRSGLGVVLAGVAAGLGAAFGLTRFLGSLLVGVKPFDPLTYSVVAFVLTGVALLACYIPARRATMVDPMEALRYE